MKVPKGTLFIGVIILLLSLSMGVNSYYDGIPKVKEEDLRRLELLTQDAENYMLQEISNPDSGWHKDPDGPVNKLFYMDGPKACWFKGKISFDSAKNLYDISFTAYINDALMPGINGLVTRVISYSDQYDVNSWRQNQTIAYQKMEIQAEFAGGRLTILNRKKL